MNNVDHYKKDLDRLCELGNHLYIKLMLEVKPESLAKLKKSDPEAIKKIEKEIPHFSWQYQKWYSETYELIRQLLPSRLGDFEEYYKGNGKPRKEITFANYTIKDALSGLQVTRTSGWEEKVIVDSSAAVNSMFQQTQILESVREKFKSSLFDIKTLVRAEILDSELEQSRVLLKNGYLRAAGALAGVALEAHLKDICIQHGLNPKQSWSLSNYNDGLKDSAYDTAEWRRIQHLTDLRNKCDHKKTDDPTLENIQDLIDGTSRVIKNVF